jgi:hypothetical protein
MKLNNGICVYKQANKNMNGNIMCSYIENVLAPCFERKERKLLIMDSAPGHKTELVKQVCKKHNFDVAMIPGGMTKYLQPLDISVNRSLSKVEKISCSRVD